MRGEADEVTPGLPPQRTWGHTPVLPGPVMEYLAVRPKGVVVDCTAGLGGHSALIAAALEGGRLIALDRDPASVATVQDRLSSFQNVTVLHRNYGCLRAVLDELHLERVDGVLIDAGLSSRQLDDPERGFSFQESGVLDMRMDTSAGMTAREYLARTPEAELGRILKEYGDVRPARRIAAALVRRREANRLVTTEDLAAAVAEALPFVSGCPDETRTVFQAIRMAVNEEIRWLETGLEQAVDALAPGGRLVAISFHSGEDRLVKNVLRAAAHPRLELTPDGRVKSRWPARLKVLTPKPVTADGTEIGQNPRARSARLRAAVRL